MTRVLAFDIGIKNLAWCCIKKGEDGVSILGWDNYNLLADESNVDKKASQKCAYCSAKALYETKSSLTRTCARHCPPLLPALRSLGGDLLKKLPAVKDARAILEAKGLKKIPVKKAELEEELSKHYSLPIQTQKVSKAPDAGLLQIHDGIKKLVLENKELWDTCDAILLENQPAFKNPTMKSVQMLLFATLRLLLKQPPPLLKLVHAGKKVKDVKSGDEGYKDRKAGSEARAESFLKDPKLSESSKASASEIWKKASKKSDLADALCMCLDFGA